MVVGTGTRLYSVGAWLQVVGAAGDSAGIWAARHKQEGQLLAPQLNSRQCYITEASRLSF